MRAVLVTQPTSAGVANFVLGVGREAAQRGHEVTLVCPRSDALGNAASNFGAVVRYEDLSRGFDVKDLVHVGRLRELFKTVDLVHLNSAKAGTLGRLALASMPTRPMSLFTPNGWSWYAGGEQARRVYRQVERVLAPLTDVIHCVSEEEAANARAVLGSRPKSVRIIENGVDVERFKPDGYRAPRNPSGFLVVCVGRLCQAKGQDVAIRALRSMVTGGVTLRLVGDGEVRDDLVVLARQLGVTENVEFVGEDDPAPHLRAADVVVVPSRYDGLSYVLLEAMACGCSIVATSVPGTSVLPNSSPIVQPDAPEELARALDAMLGDDVARERAGNEARSKVAARFTELRSTRRVVDLWQELVGQPAPGRDAA